MTDCNCKKKDAWRCAVDRNLKSVACMCACHKKIYGKRPVAVIIDDPIVDIRRAVADYMGSDGCACCRGDEHDDHAAALAKLLEVPRYADDSGYDFHQFRSKK